jgi:choice-of-anchor B domain-containing protein
MKHSLLFAAAFGLVCSSSAQVSCGEDGFAGSSACLEVDLMSSFTLSALGGGNNGNDCWGWVDEASGREFVLYGRANGTAVVEITDPVEPVYLANIPTATVSSIWRDIKVYGHYAYIVSEASGHGMQVVDLAQVLNITPGIVATLTPVTTYSSFGKAHNVIINEESGYAYAVGTNTFSGGLHIISLANPAAPALSGAYDAAYTHDAHPIVYNGPDAAYQGHELVFCFHGYSGMSIVDATDKSDVSFVSGLTYNQLGYTHQGWVNDDHTLCFINDELDETNFGNNTRTYIVDISDLENPFILDFFEAPVPAIDHNHYVVGDRLFQANYLSGMRVLDISDAANGNLELVAYYDTNPESDAAEFGGAWSVYPYFPSGNVAISTMTGLYIVRPSESVWGNAAIPGCMYGFAGNYNPDATVDDGSCVEAGCTDEAALNYSATAVVENGSCVFGSGSSCAEDVNADGLVSIQDLLLLLGAFGNDCQI